MWRIIIAGAFIGVAVFFIWHLTLFFAPPTLTIEDPEDNHFTEAAEIVFSGSIEQEQSLTVNGEVVYISTVHSTFQVRAPLAKGENKFVFEAKDKLGRVRRVVRRVYRE